jgi:hypothetical protein
MITTWLNDLQRWLVIDVDGLEPGVPHAAEQQSGRREDFLNEQ